MDPEIASAAGGSILARVNTMPLLKAATQSEIACPASESGRVGASVTSASDETGISVKRARHDRKNRRVIMNPTLLR